MLDQDKATDQWNYYQAHKIRANDTALASDLLSVVTIADKDAAKKMAKGYADHQAKWADEPERRAGEGRGAGSQGGAGRGPAPTASTWAKRCWRLAWSSPRLRCSPASASTGTSGIVFSLVGIASALRSCFSSRGSRPVSRIVVNLRPNEARLLPLSSFFAAHRCWPRHPPCPGPHERHRLQLQHSRRLGSCRYQADASSSAAKGRK